MTQKLYTDSLDYKIQDKMLLDNITIAFEGGFLHGILGPNGSGKSTLLKTLSGIWKPTKGTVLWNEQPLLAMERNQISKIISLVPQSPFSAFDFLVEDIVAMGRYPYDTKYWNATEDHLVHHALNLVDAWHLRRRKITQLSQGERQRVYIARALVTESPILLLDEPTASLDIQHQLEIWELLEKLVLGGKIVIITTHDLSIAAQYCHQVAVLNKGKCIGKGTFSSLMNESLLEEVFGVEETFSVNTKRYQRAKSKTF